MLNKTEIRNNSGDIVKHGMGVIHNFVGKNNNKINKLNLHYKKNEGTPSSGVDRAPEFTKWAKEGGAKINMAITFLFCVRMGIFNANICIKIY